MKIQFAKVTGDPKHTLNAKKIKRLLSLVPQEWTQSFNLINVGNQLHPQSGCFDRPVIISEYSKRLNILDRGFSELKIIEEILIELFQRAPIDGKRKHNFTAHYANHLDSHQLKEIKNIIEPYIQLYQFQSSFVAIEIRSV